MALGWRALSRRLHFSACMATMGLCSALVFSPAGQPWAQPFYLLPPLAWAAVRFPEVGTPTALVIILVSAAVGINPYGTRITDPGLAEIILAQALVVAVGFGGALAWVVFARQRGMARSRDLMQTVDLGIFMTRELDGKILAWSKGAERLYGWTAAEAIGQSSHALLRTSFSTPLADIEKAVLDGGEWRGDLGHVTKDGRKLTVAVHKVRRIKTNGHVVVLLEAITDVTQERADQAALAELNRTLEQRIEDAVAVREQAQARAKQAHNMRALGQIAAGVAHEFNNILQAVVGSLEVIAGRPNDSTRVTQFAAVAQNAAARGSLITSRLLGFAGRAPFQTETVDTAMVLDALVDVLAHTLGGIVTVHLEMAPALPTVIVDKSEFETAIINLVTNARDALPDGGTIWLVAGTERVANDGAHEAGLSGGNYVRFAVRDRGIGMDATTLRRAAEPFFTTKDIGKGTGLGLSMVKGFAEQAGGGVTIDSAPCQGTTVTLWLPAGEMASAVASQVYRRHNRATGTASGCRVLFVDDEEMVRETLAYGLRETDLEVVTAQGGTEALALLDAGERIDVLVSDYAMPGMDGLTLITAARARRPTLPALILTGYVEAIGAAGVEAGLMNSLSVLRKPIAAKELAASIRAVMTLASNGQNPACE